MFTTKAHLVVIFWRVNFVFVQNMLLIHAVRDGVKKSAFNTLLLSHCECESDIHSINVCDSSALSLRLTFVVFLNWILNDKKLLNFVNLYK